jgi:trimethylamine--corrinoid protein Co-methyltransferase
MFSLLTTINSGIDFVLHSAGILNTFMAFSYEKLILDDEMIGMLRRYMQGVEVTPDTLAYDVIAAVGHGGHFLGEDHTLERCRSAFWEPAVADRNGFKQPSDEKQDIAIYARQRWHELLESHEDPPIGKVVLRQLQAYVEKNT